jgi:hypothetical protein
MEDKKSTYRKTDKLQVQQRDMVIFRFLDRVGYANLEHITIAIMMDSSEKNQATILRRLYLLRRFNYVKVFASHLGNYYALDKKGKINLTILESIKLDQLEHHNFLIDLFFHVENEEILSEREVIAKYKIVGKKGKIPDMIINDWIIEYERSCKSLADAKSVIDYWTIEQDKNLCVIYNTEEIKNKYTQLLNPKVKLLSKSHYKEILIITGSKIKVEAKEITQLEIEEIIPANENIKKPFLSRITGGVLDKYK